MEDYQAQLIKQIVKDSEVIYKIQQRRPSPKLYVVHNTVNKMKIVKINKRYKLYSKGYTHVLRWNYYSSIVTPYEQALAELYGPEKWWSDSSPWKHVNGKPAGRWQERPYFIYVKDESMLTMLLLKIKS